MGTLRSEKLIPIQGCVKVAFIEDVVFELTLKDKSDK